MAKSAKSKSRSRKSISKKAGKVVAMRSKRTGKVFGFLKYVQATAKDGHKFLRPVFLSHSQWPKNVNKAEIQRNNVSQLAAARRVRRKSKSRSRSALRRKSKSRSRSAPRRKSASKSRSRSAPRRKSKVMRRKSASKSRSRANKSRSRANKSRSRSAPRRKSASKSRSRSSKKYRPITAKTARAALKRYYNAGVRSGKFASKKGMRQSMAYDLNHTVPKSRVTRSSKYLENPHKYDYPGVDTGSQRKPKLAGAALAAHKKRLSKVRRSKSRSRASKSRSRASKSRSRASKSRSRANKSRSRANKSRSRAKKSRSRANKSRSRSMKSRNGRRSKR